MFLSSYLLNANNKDSISYYSIRKKNLIEIQFLGNNYVSPFVRRYAPLSINYSRAVILKKSHFQFSVGLSTFRAFYRERQGTHTITHEPWAVCIPAGVLWRVNNKRYGVAVGLFYTSAFVKQSYFVQLDRNMSEWRTVNYDYQFMPNVCYEFRTKHEELVLRISYTPKISSAFKANKPGYEWSIFPVWFGISIGSGW